MKCNSGYYYDRVVNLCSPCADICDPGRNVMSYCRENCPGFVIFSVMSNYRKMLVKRDCQL